MLLRKGKMKTLTLSVVFGAIYTAIAIAITSAVSEGVLGGDDKLALFLIGFGAGVFTARKLEWID